MTCALELLCCLKFPLNKSGIAEHTLFSMSNLCQVARSLQQELFATLLWIQPARRTRQEQAQDTDEDDTTRVGGQFRRLDRQIVRQIEIDLIYTYVYRYLLHIFPPFPPFSPFWCGAFVGSASLPCVLRDCMRRSRWRLSLPLYLKQKFRAKIYTYRLIEIQLINESFPSLRSAPTGQLRKIPKETQRKHTF